MSSTSTPRRVNMFMSRAAAAAWVAYSVLLGRLPSVLPGALSHLSYAYAQRELGVARTGLMMCTAPLWAALLGWLLLGEPPQLHHAIGAALILPSIALATWR